MLRPVRFFVAVLAVTACGRPVPGVGAGARTSNVGAADVSGPRLPSDDDDAWVVTMRGIRGDCAPDATSCDELYTVSSDGAWAASFEPHPLAQDGKPVTSHKVMPEEDFEELRALVESSTFEDDMTSGFACQGEKPSHDYTWRITLTTPRQERAQQAAACISGPTDADNAPRRLLRLLSK